MTKPMELIGDKGRAAIEELFPGTLEAINSGKCPACLKPTGDFKNDVSKREYSISGLCQKCQDYVYGEPYVSNS